jgi:hypothetical protein
MEKLKMPGALGKAPFATVAKKSFFHACGSPKPTFSDIHDSILINDFVFKNATCSMRLDLIINNALRKNEYF